jgi:hypothetical protein
MGGGPALPGGGLNSIYDNTLGEVYNASGYELMAEDNFWGGGDLVPAGPNTVDSDPYLDTDPN